MTLQHAKFGVTQTAGGFRRILLRRQSNTLYEIQLVHWTWFTSTLVETNDGLMGALSIRQPDQIDDEVAIGFSDLVDTEGIFAVFSGIHDFETEGAAAVVGNHDVPFSPKPYSVPQCAVLLNFAVQGSARLGVEIFFTRTRVSNSEYAAAMVQVGGRIQTA